MTVETLVAPAVREPVVGPGGGLDPETRDVLREAKAKIVRGWCQGAYRRGDRSCIVGAISWNGKPGPKQRAILTLRSLIDRNSLANWNDKPGRTQAEVVALFDKALTE